jgi:hypothetical protein
MITLFTHAHPWIVVGSFLMALAACSPGKPETTADPGNEDTTSDGSASTTITGETTAPSEPDTTSTSSSSTTAPSEPDTTSTSSSSTTAPSEPDTTSTSSSSTTAPSEPDTTSTTTLDPDTTTTGGACAVDLIVSLALDFDQCDESLVVIATVHNVGTVDVPAGVDLALYEGTDASGLKLGSEPIPEPLPASSSTDVVWVLNAPPARESSDYYVEIGAFECDEDDNSAVVTDAACPD